MVSRLYLLILAVGLACVVGLTYGTTVGVMFFWGVGVGWFFRGLHGD